MVNHIYQLPDELVKMLITYLDIEAVKNLALTSKKMHTFTTERLWSKLHYFTIKFRGSADFLEKISHLPIQEIHMKDFNTCPPLWIGETLPDLKLLHIDRWPSRDLVLESGHFENLKVPIVLHTNMLKMRSSDDFDDLLKIMKYANVFRLVVDHSLSRFKRFDWFPDPH